MAQDFRMNTAQMIDSFIEILQCVSVEDVLVSPDEPLSIVVSDASVDALDFELAVTCFEATHRVFLDYESLNLEEVGDLTIRRMIEEHLVTEDRELLDPLLITKQFLAYRDSLLEALKESQE